MPLCNFPPLQLDFGALPISSFGIVPCFGIHNSKNNVALLISSLLSFSTECTTLVTPTLSRIQQLQSTTTTTQNLQQKKYSTPCPSPSIVFSHSVVVVNWLWTPSTSPSNPLTCPWFEFPAPHHHKNKDGDDAGEAAFSAAGRPAGDPAVSTGCAVSCHQHGTKPAGQPGLGGYREQRQRLADRQAHHAGKGE